ncbi:hypothetical protein [Microbispora sp. H10836]|uniref:hypothetical protein n=1 Tax=Microbispora sp. H10836 TaxID=2729106 RepID=UPI001474E67A|nr:hypothetical protein [Microbispora sp. H10836]
MARAEHVDSAALARLIGGWRAEDVPLPHALAGALAELIAGNVLPRGPCLQRADGAACKLDDAQLARLEQAPEEGPMAHAWDDQFRPRNLSH